MANTFTGDSSCIALYNFESGALTTDSIGTNTLTNSNVAESAGDYKEGSCCADFEKSSSAKMSISNSSLSAGFPFKSTDTNKQGSFCFWFKMESTPSGVNGGLITKWGNGYNVSSFAIGVSTSGIFYVAVSNGTTLDNTNFSGYGTIATGVWYHVGVTLDAASKTCTLRIWNDTDSTVSTLTHTYSITPYASTATVNIGSEDYWNYYWDGLIDEVVIFNRILSIAEIDSIRTGGYPAPGAPDMGFPLPVLVMGTPSPSNFEKLVYPISILAMTGRPTVHGNLTNLEYPITFPLPGLAITGAQVGQISSAGFMLPDVVMNAGSKVATMGVPVPALAITAKAAVTSSGACSIPLPELVISTTMGVTGSFAGGVPLGVLDADDGDNFSGSMSLNFPLPSCSITPAQSNAYSLRYARGSTCY